MKNLIQKALKNVTVAEMQRYSHKSGRRAFRMRICHFNVPCMCAAFSSRVAVAAHAMLGEDIFNLFFNH